MSKHEDIKPSTVDTPHAPAAPAAPPAPAMVTMSQEQLVAMMASVVAMAAKQPTREENIEAILERDRPKGTPNERILLVSRGPTGTGASFVATHAASKKGRRMVQVHEYWYPEGVNEAAHKLGLARVDKGGKESMRFKQWRWETYYRADLRAFVGAILNPLLPMYAMTEEEMLSCVDTMQPDKPRKRTADPTYATQVLTSVDVESHPIAAE